MVNHPTKNGNYRPRCIVVDDDDYFRAVVVKILESINGRVLAEAIDGLQALELCQQHRPDWLFTDVCLPGLNGLELVTCIRNEGIDCKIGVLSDAVNSRVKAQFSAFDIDFLIDKRSLEINAFAVFLKQAIFKKR